MAGASELPSSYAFLGLPGEIRNNIYKQLFPPPTEDLLASCGGTLQDSLSPTMASSRLHILLSCRQIHSECRAIAFTHTAFHIICAGNLTRGVSRLFSRLFALGSPSVALIRYATLTWRALASLKTPLATPLSVSMAIFSLSMPSLTHLSVRYFYYYATRRAAVMDFLVHVMLQLSSLRLLALVLARDDLCSSDSCPRRRTLILADYDGPCGCGDLWRLAELEQQEPWLRNQIWTSLNSTTGSQVLTTLAGKRIHHFKRLRSESHTGCMGLHDGERGENEVSGEGRRKIRHVRISIGTAEELRNVIGGECGQTCEVGPGDV